VPRLRARSHAALCPYAAKKDRGPHGLLGRRSNPHFRSISLPSLARVGDEPNSHGARTSHGNLLEARELDPAGLSRGTSRRGGSQNSRPLDLSGGKRPAPTKLGWHGNFPCCESENLRATSA
jgi:hypothetical protein